ncbi:MAG: LamG-like jellyroll fold domain-containing protein, partial [Limisphaerales bacterium]
TDGLNLTAYAVSDPTNLYVTIVNKEYGANARDASVTILPSGFGSGNVSAMFLVATNGNVFATNDATLGGATITNNAPWLGQWTTLNPLTNGQCVVAVPAGSAAVVKIYNVILFIPPLIVTNLPQRVFVVPGQVYQYSVGAEGGLPLSYQWYQDATPVAGQTNATYAVTAGSVGSSTSYFVAITNIYASVTSSVSTLTVIAPPTNSLATTIEQLNPAGYWPMHEVESAAHGDIETNYGDLGLLGTAYYPDWANANNHIIARGVPGALAYDSDPAVNFTYAGGANGVGPAAGTYTNVLAVPHTSPLATLNPPFSVECWFYPTNTSSQDIWDQTGFEGLNAGSSGGAAGNVGGIRLVWSNGTNTGFQVYSYYNNSTVISEGFSGNPGGPPAAPRNHWYHLVVTCNLNTNISLYTNGVMAFTTPAIGLYTPDFWTPLTIGGGRGGTKAVAGYIDEFAVYTNVLSTNDILQHYSDGVGESQAGAYVAAVLADNPVIYLRMDAPSYTPPASATWPKLLNLGSAGIPGVYSPGTMPGILSGPISSSGAPFGGVTNNSALFSGVSSFADAGNVSAFNPTGSNANFAVMALFRGNPCDGRTQSIVGHGASSWQLGLTTEGKIVFNAGNGNKTAGATGSSAGDIQTAGVYNDGNWHQVAAVNQTNAISIYVDGVLDTYGTPAGITTTNIIPGNTDDVIIGSDPSYTNSPAGVGRTFAGQICDVAFFTNALTAAQIAAIYLSASTPLPETLTLTKAGNSQLQLNWSHGTLQTATNVTGPYNDVTNASQPYTIHTTNSQQFYRVMQN